MQPKTVIVTGASRGLGRATALILARMGANVVITARSAQDLEALEKEINAGAGGRAAGLAGDIARAETSEKLVELALARFGRIDSLVNNAGVLEPLAVIADADPDAWRRNWEVNVLSAVLLTRHALPQLRANSGRVVHVSSGAATFAMQGWGAYCASKAALNHFSNVLALEEPEITSIALRPGIIDTAMQGVIREAGAQAMTPDAHQRFVNHHKDGDLLSPEAAGRVLAALALYAPHEWSGQFVTWDAASVQELVEQST